MDVDAPSFMLLAPKERTYYSLGSSVHLSGCLGFMDICAYKYFIAVIVAIHSSSLAKIGSLNTLDIFFGGSRGLYRKTGRC